MLRIVVIAMVFTLAVRSACAEHIHAIERQQGSVMKVENGLILSWRVKSEDASSHQIELFDRSGKLLTKLNVLQPAPGARRVSIYDVSAWPGRMVAVAAVFRRKGNRPVDTLLTFDFQGRLTSAFVLEPSREIMRLALDEQMNLWTLTTGTDGQDPQNVPMVVVHDSSSGKVLKEILRRSDFPYHAAHTEVSSQIGNLESGYQSGSFWFWLPGSKELVLIRTADGQVNRAYTGLPQINQLVPLRIIRQSSGSLIAEVREPGKGYATYFRWSLATGWKTLDPGACRFHRLIGEDQERLVYIWQQSDGADLCSIQTSP